MKVKDLIKALQKCDQDADLYVEACNTNELLHVYAYTKEEDTCVYLGDDCYYVDECLVEEEHYKNEVVA